MFWQGFLLFGEGEVRKSLLLLVVVMFVVVCCSHMNFSPPSTVRDPKTRSDHSGAEEKVKVGKPI